MHRRLHQRQRDDAGRLPEKFNAYYSELVDYFQALTTCFPYLAIKHADALQKTDFLNALVDRALSCSGQIGMESPQVVIAAVALLCEIWLTFQFISMFFMLALEYFYSNFFIHF